ncbi:MAG: hypothetical protein JOZ03_03910 [Gammaproteobacteria bacterium]|nr:hypothetical protein [Gammaproteobacteria bacterium]
MPLRAASYAASLVQRAAAHPVARAAAGFAGITGLVKAVAFLKEAVVAAAFGVGPAMDSYLMALVIITFPSAVLLNAAQTVFIREYVRAITLRGEAAAARFLRGSMFTVLLALTLTLALWVAVLPAILSIVGHGLAPPQRALVAANVVKLIPYYYLTGINLLGYGILQARQMFLRSALFPIATPLVVMGLVAMFSADLDVLIGALTAGTAAETVFIFVTGRAHFASTAEGPAEATSLVRDFATGSLTLVPGTLIAGLSPVIEQTIASGLGSGAIAGLGYAAKLPATLNTLLTTAIGVTILPYFSDRLSRGDVQSCRSFFVRYTGLIVLAGLAIAAVAALGSAPFVRLAFEHGHFTARDTLFVTAIQQAYLWQLPGAMVSTLALRYVVAQGRYRALTLGTMAMLPFSAFLQWWLARGWGAPGLAFGTSAGVTLTALVFFRLALRNSSEGAP